MRTNPRNFGEKMELNTVQFIYCLVLQNVKKNVKKEHLSVALNNG